MVTRAFTCALVAIALIFGAQTSFAMSNPPKPKSTPLPPVDTSSMQSLGQLDPSFYWVALETKDGLKKDQQVKDMEGNVLVAVGQKFFRALTLEGTGRLLDGRMINWNGKIQRADGTWEYRYRWCGPEAPFGYGFEGRPLEEFKTVAVDPAVVPLDSVLFIPAARGAPLPDGTLHDGYFKALDIGSAIVNRRIDVFTSYGDQSKVFQGYGFVHGKPTEIYLVK